MIEVTTKKCIYQFNFDHAQIEVTGKCNMRCNHCRAAFEKGKNLKKEKIFKIIEFAVSHVENINDPNSFRLIISGGEPFLHPDWYEILKYSQEKHILNVYITTNGSLIDGTVINKLNEIKSNFNNLFVQVSVDGINSKQHDQFRHFDGAFNRCIETFKLLHKSKIKYSMRTTIIPKYLDDMEERVKLAIKNKCLRLGFGSVIWFGRASKDLILKPNEKKRFIETIIKLKRKYKNKIEISTEDPLKFICGYEYKYKTDKKVNPDDESFFGGCTAGITGFDCSAEGNIRPCSVLDFTIVNVDDGNIEDITKRYQDSKIIKDFASREFLGKCNACRLKRLCGGCRAQAYAIHKDYIAEDPTCWK